MDVRSLLADDRYHGNNAVIIVGKTLDYRMPLASAVRRTIEVVVLRRLSVVQRDDLEDRVLRFFQRLVCKIEERLIIEREAGIEDRAVVA